MCERTDGFKYEGEWMANQRQGYGSTTFSDGTKEEGKYKYNILVASKKKNVLGVKTAKVKERVDTALRQARKAMEVAKQKGDIALSR